MFPQNATSKGVRLLKNPVTQCVQRGKAVNVPSFGKIDWRVFCEGKEGEPPGLQFPARLLAMGMPVFRPLRRLRIVLCLLCCLGAREELEGQGAAAGPDAPREGERRLAWRWEKGKRYAFQTETETVLSLKPLGKEGEQVLQVIQNTDVTVKAGKQPGTKELVVRFVTLRARMMAEGKTFLYDSEEPSDSDPALRQMLADSSGRHFSLIYSEDDRFVELGTVDQPAALPGSEPSLLAVVDARQVAQLYRRSLEMVLPRPEVRAGDKWTSVEQMTFPQAGEMEVRMNCHYAEDVERDKRAHAKVTFQGKLSQSPETEGAGKRAMVLGGHSTIAGHVFYDLERRVVSLSMFLGSIVILHEGKNLPIRQTVTTRLQGIEPAPEG